MIKNEETAMTESKETTMSRSQELMEMKRWKLPYAAFKYAEALCDKYGMCCEVLLTAYAHYANYMEDLPCDEEAYEVDLFGRNFFEDLTGKKK